jgi:hypothetical protein
MDYVTNLAILGDISDFHGSEYEHDSLLGYAAV